MAFVGQPKVHGSVEELNAIGRSFTIISAAVDGTDAAAVQAFVDALTALNVSLLAIGDLSSALEVKLIIDGHDAGAVPASAGGVAITVVPF